MVALYNSWRIVLSQFLQEITISRQANINNNNKHVPQVQRIKFVIDFLHITCVRSKLSLSRLEESVQGASKPSLANAEHKRASEASDEDVVVAVFPLSFANVFALKLSRCERLLAVQS